MSRTTLPPASPQTPASDVDDSKWTVMVFMGAATINGESTLVDAADADVAEMEFVGSGPGLNIFVQIHGKGVPQRGHIGISPMAAVPLEERDPSYGHALISFIRWSLARAAHNPRERNHHSMLVLWGHANEFAIGHAPTKDSAIHAFDFADLSYVLERAQETLGPPGTARFDILGFDAGDLATVEMACQLGHLGNYLLGSQSGIPIPGWPYDRILDRLRQPVDRLLGPAELGSYVVQVFCESYASSRPVSLSLLDLKRVPELAAHADVLATLLVNAIAAPGSLLRTADLFSRSQTTKGKPYVDLTDLCLNLVRESSDPLVIAAAQALGDFLLSPRSSLAAFSDEGSGRPFVVAHGCNAVQMARLNGISIYAPHVEPTMDVDLAQPLYHSFRFVQETGWSLLVHALAERQTATSRPDTKPTRPHESKRREHVFVCYAHNDSVWVNRLRPHLEPLVGTLGLDLFIDTQIEPGTKWRNQIDDALESATVAIIFVSADFLNSKFIRDVELPTLLQHVHDVRPYKDGLLILYLMVSAVSDLQMKRTGLADFQALIGPKDPPLSKLRTPNQQAVFAKVAEEVEKRLLGREGLATTD